MLIASSEAGITAHAGGGQANAYQLSAQINQASVVASSADSVKLLKPIIGMEVVVINDGANSLQVFGYSTDTVDGVAGSTGVALAAAKRAIFQCTAENAWKSLMGTKSA